MQITTDKLSDTTVKLTIVANEAQLMAVKHLVLDRLSKNVRVPGFREGKAPIHLIEKQLDQTAFQSEFMEQAINQLYGQAIEQEKVRPVAQPTVELTKFVPFSTLEFTAEVAVIGTIKVADYKKIKLTKKSAPVVAKDVDEVLENLRSRAAEKKVVDRAAKLGDETVIDFKGVDAKTKEPIAGADGKDYPLVLGSKSFIPGFEEQLVGVTPNTIKEFTITFPSDYGSVALQSKKVIFTVTVNSVNELVPPKLDDAFAATIGPFKTLAELRADIKKQVAVEREQQEQRAFENELLEKIAEKSSVAIPKVLVDAEIDRIEEDEKRNVVYRGQTWQEHLDEEGITSEAHYEKQRPVAELRVKAGLILAVISEQEKIDVSRDELDLRLSLLKGQYTDPAMQAELDNPESRREIASRLLSEKTISKLISYVS